MDDEASEFLSSIQMGDHGQATNDLDSDQREIMELVSSHYIIIYIYMLSDYPHVIPLYYIIVIVILYSII